MSLDTTGVDQLLDSFADVVDELQNGEAMHADAADEVIGYVRPPYRTGLLASTVEAKFDDHGFLIVAGGPRAPYGPIVNARVPFLDIAAEEREQAVVAVYTAHVEKLLDTIKGA